MGVGGEWFVRGAAGVGGVPNRLTRFRTRTQEKSVGINSHESGLTPLLRLTNFGKCSAGLSVGACAGDETCAAFGDTPDPCRPLTVHRTYRSLSVSAKLFIIPY
ncbi:MAG: hypothetical protein FWH20_08050 [Oscillospiraceae bacterium]|nr:hypothetical protein [Oscillospiraceae bacterium]